jgi:hypothetical protein
MPAERKPWYVRRPAVVFFKVNRRPYPQETIYPAPEDSFEHFVKVLPFGEPVETTGRGGHRTWFLGHGEQENDADFDARILVGQIGWVRDETVAQTSFDTSNARFIHDVVSSSTANDAPFVYDGETQRLAVMLHPTFASSSVARVFEELLNRGEQRAFNRYEWSVEPLLDYASFRAWLDTTAVVQRVTFVAKLPNPDGMEAFEEVLGRLEARQAKALTETWEARDPEEGLQNIEEDRDASQMIAMAENGYGTVRARGEDEEGRGRTYNQTQRVRRETIPEVPSSWGAMIGVFIDFAIDQIRHRRRD